MTDTPLESLFEELVRKRPPQYNETLELVGATGMYYWNLSPSEVWHILLKFYRYLEGKENEI